MKHLVSRKKSGIVYLSRSTLSLIALVITVALIFCIVNEPAIVGASATTRLLPVYSVERTDKTVSFTFDAGWGNEDTQLLIDILAKYQISATFFTVGSWVEKYPKSVKSLADAGHEVMNHSDDHAHFTQLSTEQMIENLQRCNEKIAAITGKTPTLFRAPYGEYDDHVVAAASSIGMTAIQWDVDSLDWKELSADQIYDRVTSAVQPGSIILFHNAALHTPEALPSIIEYLLQNGYSICPVSQLLLTGDTVLDHTGRQKPAQPA